MRQIQQYNVVFVVFYETYIQVSRKFMKKRHQHFIPRTYLKHFKNSFDSQHINTFNKIENKFVDNIGINDICVEKDFYTLKNLSGDDKLALEE